MQENVMNESIAMVPDAEQRLKLAIKDLNTYLVRICPHIPNLVKQVAGRVGLSFQKFWYMEETLITQGKKPMQEENIKSLHDDEISEMEMNHARQALSHAESEVRV